MKIICRVKRTDLINAKTKEELDRIVGKKGNYVGRYEKKIDCYQIVRYD